MAQETWRDLPEGTTGTTHWMLGSELGAQGHLPDALASGATGSLTLTGTFATGLTLGVAVSFGIYSVPVQYTTKAADATLAGVATGLAAAIASSTAVTGAAAFLKAPTPTGASIILGALYAGFQGNLIGVSSTGASNTVGQIGFTFSSTGNCLTGGVGAGYILPQQRIPKRDIATALGIVLNAIGLPNNVIDNNWASATAAQLDTYQAWITINGTFHQSLIRDSQYAGRTVIVVGHGGESPDKPAGIGQNIGLFPASAFSDPTPAPPVVGGTGTAYVPPPSTMVHVSGTEVTTTVDVSIFDTRYEIGFMIDALVGTLMRNVIQFALMNELNYSRCRQVGKNEATNVFQPQVGEPFAVWQFDRTYECTWYDTTLFVDALVNLVQQHLTVDDPFGSTKPSDGGNETITTVV